MLNTFGDVYDLAVPRKKGREMTSVEEASDDASVGEDSLLSEFLLDFGDTVSISSQISSIGLMRKVFAEINRESRSTWSECGFSRGNVKLQFMAEKSTP
jgi:hypothetical protein